MRISVVIPVYNVSAYIESCIHSVMNQTYPNLECIMVDDCGTDDSVVKCEKMIAEYDGPIRFKMIHHEQNRGLSAARNTGTATATGEYILYVDSDDEITPDCIEKLIKPILDDDTIEMVLGSTEKVYDDYSTRLIRCTENGNHLDLNGQEAVREHFFSGKGLRGYVWNRLTRKDFLYRYNITFKENLMWEDQLWIFWVMKHLSHFYIIPDITYQYHIHNGSISLATNYDTIQFHRGMVFYEISSNFTPDDSNREAKFYVKDFCHHYLGCPQPKLYHLTACKFRKELTLTNDTLDYLRLVTVILLSKTWIGRETFRRLKRAYRHFYRKQDVLS